VQRLREVERLHARLPPDALDLQSALLAVEDGLDPADEPVAVEDGEDVVAVLPLCRGDVHLEPVVEVPERLGAGSVADEPVERREERGAKRHGAVFGRGMNDEPAALELDSERAEALLRDQLLRPRPGDRLGLRIPPLGDVPDTLLAATANDGNLATRREDLE